MCVRDKLYVTCTLDEVSCEAEYTGDSLLPELP